jgi:glycosyltransferase involved in cell wall biosynthesis
MKLLVFLDELYYKYGTKYLSKFNAGRFLLNLKKNYELLFAFPVTTHKGNISNYTTAVDNVRVVELGEWDSLLSYLKRYNYYNRLLEKKLSSIIEEVDVVWLRFPSIPGLKIAEICLKNKKPMIIHLAGDISKAYENKKYQGFKRFPAYALGKWMHNKTKRIIQSSNNHIYPLCTGSQLERAFKHPNTKFFIDSEVNPIKNNIEINSPPKKFIYVGRLLESKGILLLLKAWSLIENDLELNIVGYGKLEKQVKEYCSQDHRVKFHGFKTGSELAKLYTQSDCLILPSITSEGFPRVITEAWAYGLPVIASNVGGISSMGKHKENLLFFEPENLTGLIANIKVISNDVELFKTLQLNSYHAAQKVSKNTMLNLVKEILDKYDNK